MESGSNPAVQTISATRLLRVHSTGGIKDLGRLLGEAYKPEILAGRERWMNYFIKQEEITTDEQLQEFTSYATAGIRKCCPNASLFLDGLSEGAGVDMFSSMLDFEIQSWDHLISLRKKQEKAMMRAKKIAAMVNGTTSTEKSDDEKEGVSAPPAEVKGHCTGLAFASTTPEDFSIVAQTVELPLKLYGFGDADIVIHLQWQDGDRVRRLLCYDSDGRCCPVGFNSDGFAMGIFTLMQKHEVGFMKPSITIQALQWEFLLGSYTVQQAVQFLRQLPCPCMSGAAMLFADKTGAVNVELNADGVHCEDPKLDLLLRRSNHPMFATTETYNCNSVHEQKYSIERLKQLDGLLRTQAKKAKHKASLDSFKVEPVGALAALCGSDLICSSRVLAVVVSDVVEGRLFCLFKERWSTQGNEKHRVKTGKQQVHKVRRRLYMYNLDVEDNAEDMVQDLEHEEDGTDSASDSSSGSSSTTDNDESDDDEEDEEDEEESEGAEEEADDAKIRMILDNMAMEQDAKPNEADKAVGSTSLKVKKSHHHHPTVTSGDGVASTSETTGSPSKPRTLVPRKRKPSN